MTMDVFDSHCHLAAYPDPMEIVRESESHGIGVVAVTEHPDEYRRLRARLGPRPGVTVAIGLHPLRAATFRPIDLARFFRLAPAATWIGEIGLDFSKLGVETKKEQRRVFEAVLNEAHPGKHPLTVHSRKAERETIELLAQAHTPAVLHWYTGPLDLIDGALSAGLYFSINPAMTRSARFADLAAAIPPDRVLLESDGPYGRTGRRPSRPSDLRGVVADLARRWSVDREAAATVLRENYSRVTAQHGEAN